MCISSNKIFQLKGASSEVYRTAIPINSTTCQCYDYFGANCVAWCTTMIKVVLINSIPILFIILSLLTFYIRESYVYTSRPLLPLPCAFLNR